MLNRPVFLAAFSYVLIAISSISLAAGPPAPDFSNWKCWGETVESPRTFRVTCFDKEPKITAEAMAVRYSGEINLMEGDLLVWFTFERSKDIFSVHNGIKVYRVDGVMSNGYKAQRNPDGILEWTWLETRELIRTSFGEGQKVPVADVNSPLGKEYFAFMKRMGRDPAKINMPSIKFYK